VRKPFLVRIGEPVTAGRWLIVLFALSVAVSLSRQTYGAAFGFTDHVSHMNAARLFPRVGGALWRIPISKMFAELDPAKAAALPADVRSQGGILDVPGWPLDKPLIATWTTIPRPYPPGDLVLVAPIATLYHFTSMSFATATHLLIVLFLAVAHIAFWLIWRLGPHRGVALYGGAAIVAYLYVVYWTLFGFYDAAAVVPLLLCIRSIVDQKPIAAVVSFAVAAFVHFRALYYVPWLLVAAAEIVRLRSWRDCSAREWFALALAALLGGSALYTFLLVQPWLSCLPLGNPIHPGHVRLVPAIAFALAFGAAAALFGRGRAWLDLAILAWSSLCLILTRQVQAWHAVLLFPWIFAPCTRPLARVARIEFVTIVTLAVFL
jgi:hypothetical protein